MKKLNLLITLLLVVATLLTSCGTYTPAFDDPSHGDGAQTPPDTSTGGEGNGNGDETDDPPYTVTLNVNGKAYTPNAANGPYYVQWSNGFSVYTAELIDGKAEISGLDDDYTVTLLDVPSGYTYNANAYIATTDDRDVSIELVKPARTTGSGSDLYSGIIELTKTGVYQTTVESATQNVFYQFKPGQSGNYVIESWISVAENNVNPIMDVYAGTFANKYFSYTLDGGGVSSTYTKNFKYEINVDDSEIGNIYAFAVKATAKDGKYPVSVSFAITKDGEYDFSFGEAELMLPTEKLQKTPNYSSLLYTLTGPEVNEGGNNVFHGEMFKLWAKGTGMPMVSLDGERGDSLSDKLSGSYQMTFVNPRTGRRIVRTIVFDPTDDLKGTVEITEQDFLAETTVSGVYSYTVCKNHKFTSLSDTDCNLCGCERAADGATTPPSVTLTLQGGSKIDFAGFTFDADGELYYGQGDNFYHFYDEENGTWGEILYAYVSAPCRFIDLAFTQIEYQGNKNLTVNGGTQNYKFFIEGTGSFTTGYFCVNHFQNQVYCPCLSECVGACPIGCPTCHPQCNQVSQEVLDAPGGYADFTNQDGVYAVTEELKDFLQKYSTSQLLFRDGNGHVETNPDVKVYSNEDDQWLFACAYYEKK